MANNEIYTVGVGTSTYTLYQKVGNNKATKVGITYCNSKECQY